jgi:hypothetical protein
MEREHLIIIALILVALYMMNKDTNNDTVQAIGPMGRIRYYENMDEYGNMDGFLPSNETFEMPSFDEDMSSLVSDTYIGASQHIKNHIRSRNMNSMFSGMVGGCGKEPFEMEDDQQDNIGQSYSP